jgi:hypothetical protein
LGHQTHHSEALMPALKNPSLVVLDNASYHNAKTEDTVCPNFNQTYRTLRLSPIFSIRISKINES